MQLKYFVYTHKRGDNGQLFYVGVGKYYFKKQNNYKLRKYDRAFTFGATVRNCYWNQIFLDCNKNVTVEIIKEFDSIEDAYELEVFLIKKHGKIHNNTGSLANMQDGGFVSDWGRAVLCYDYDGKFYKKYNNVKEAAIDLGIKSPDNIYFAINNGSSSKKKYFTYFTEGYPCTIPLKSKKSFVRRKVNSCYQYSRSGILIKVWRCVEDAAKELHIDKGSIRKCIYGKNNHAGNYVWAYNEIRFSKEVFEIGQYSVSGKLIKQYRNAGIAEKESGVFNSTILMCCKGKAKLGGGFIWKFIKV